MPMGPDTQANTRGGGSLEDGDFRLTQDLGELGHTLGSDVVEPETVETKNRVGMVRGQACQLVLDTKVNRLGGGALQRGDGAPLERLAKRGNALRVVGTLAIPVKATEQVAGQAANFGRRLSAGADGAHTKVCA